MCEPAGLDNSASADRFAPATDELIAQLRDTAAEYADGFKGNGAPNLWGLNLTSFMGERMGTVLARLDAVSRENAVLRATLVGARDELARWGWGDMHYGPQGQDQSVVAALTAIDQALELTSHVHSENAE